MVRYTFEMNSHADNIPEDIELDLIEASMGDSLHISEVTLPDGCEPVISDRDFTIATIAAPAAIRSDAAEDEEGAEDAEGEEGEETEETEEGGEE